MRNFAPITFPPLYGSEKLSSEIYSALHAEISGSKHGSRFDLRQFYLDQKASNTPSPFDVSNAYLPASVDIDDRHRQNLIALASSLVMDEPDWPALVNAFKTVYSDDEVKAHRKGGGAVKFVDSHLTYTGQVMQELASWQALNQLGETEEPQEIQTTIVSRVTTLFRLSLLEEILKAEGVAHSEGAIIDDLLLKFGGAILTIPNTRSGGRLVEKISEGKHARRDVVKRAKIAYERLLNRGGADGQILFEGSSGSENTVSDSGEHMIIGEVTPRTVELTTLYNQTEGAERIMTIGVFMESDPYTGDPKMPIMPTKTPFVFLRPFFPKTKDDFDAMMHAMAVQGTWIKSSRSLPYQYADGRVPQKGQRIPEVWIEHSV